MAAYVSHVNDCPFCIGGLEAPHAYEVRWFPNRWPALQPGPPVDFAAAEFAGTTHVPAVGAAEVVLFSPEHTQSLATLPVSQVRTVIHTSGNVNPSNLPPEARKLIKCIQKAHGDVNKIQACQ